jgi:hypothetical protein
MGKPWWICLAIYRARVGWPHQSSEFSGQSVVKKNFSIWTCQHKISYLGRCDPQVSTSKWHSWMLFNNLSSNSTCGDTSTVRPSSSMDRADNSESLQGRNFLIFDPSTAVSYVCQWHPVHKAATISSRVKSAFLNNTYCTHNI